MVISLHDNLNWRNIIKSNTSIYDTRLFPNRVKQEHSADNSEKENPSVIYCVTL